jgi:hypothetical protein
LGKHPSLKCFISVGVAVAFLASLLAGIATAKNDAHVDEEVPGETRDLAKWNVLVYIVADNDLDPYLEEDFEELKAGNSSADVNVLILVDRLYEPAYLLCVEDNDFVELESLGEINMGDPATFSWFIDYSVTNFPAERMLLFFWDHGTPTAGVGVDTTLDEESEPGTDWDWLSHHEVISSLEGKHVDVVACDECSIGQMETLYEYVSKGLSVDYFVASESYIGWRGFSYDKIIQQLILTPGMSSFELCTIIVDEFTNLFSVAPYMSEILTTQSIFDMAKIIPLGEKVTALAKALTKDIDSYRAILKAASHEAMMPWGARCESWIDMPTFVEEIMANAAKGDTIVQKACEDVLEAYAETMLGMGITKNSEMYGYQGMGILFPASHSSYTVAYADTEWGGYEIYKTFDFPNMGWLEFLEAYWGM